MGVLEGKVDIVFVVLVLVSVWGLVFQAFCSFNSSFLVLYFLKLLMGVEHSCFLKKESLLG